MTQAQIEAAAVELHKMLGLDYSMRGCSLMAEKALTAAAKVEAGGIQVSADPLAKPAAAEVDDTEWTCADCDHVQHGHRFRCEKCGHNFGTVAAAEVGERNQIIERCAQVAEKYAKKHFATNPEGLAAEIRALKDS